MVGWQGTFLLTILLPRVKSAAALQVVAGVASRAAPHPRAFVPVVSSNEGRRSTPSPRADSSTLTTSTSGCGGRLNHAPRSTLNSYVQYICLWTARAPLRSPAWRAVRVRCSQSIRSTRSRSDCRASCPASPAFTADLACCATRCRARAPRRSSRALPRGC